MANASLADHVIRPEKPENTRILYIAEYAPDEPIFAPKEYSADGGYPLYHYNVWRALKDLGYEVRSSSKPYSALFAGGNADFVFSLYNRMPINNSEVFVSSICEYIRIPYLGARPNIRALAEDKWLSKLVAKTVGLPVVEGMPYANTRALGQPPPFSGPYFVKDRFGAGSEGITSDCLQDTWEGAKRIAERFLDRGMEVLVEEFAPGLDVTVPVLGSALPIMLGFVNPVSDKPSNILTEDLKLDDPLGYEIYDVRPHEGDFKNDVALLWSVAGPIDYFRMDYRFDPSTGRRSFLEFNVCCHIGASGAVCLAAERQGLTQLDVLGHVVEYSLLRQSLGRQHLQWVL